MNLKIIWVVNHEMKDLALKNGVEPPISGSWLVDMSKKLAENKDLELYIISPSSTKNMTVKLNGITYYTIKMNLIDKIIKPSKKVSASVSKIIREINPDIIHLQGSEFAYNHAFLEHKNIPMLLSIQGLVSQISIKKNYLAEIDNIKFSGFKFIPEYLKYYRNKFRARSEINQIKSVKYISGRTTWDNSHTYYINPQITYYHLQETIRKSFYDYKWNQDYMKKHTIFAAGGFRSPLKGFHKIIEGTIFLKKEFPEISVRVPGKNLYNNKKLSVYEKFLLNKILENKLEDNIVFLGVLNDSDMALEFSRNQVYLMGSSIENSPNTLGEAMVVGIPSVVPFVGGVSDLATDGQEALFYRFGDTEHMAWQVRTFFMNDDVSRKISKNSLIRAKKQYSLQYSYEELLNIYINIIKESSWC